MDHGCGLAAYFSGEIGSGQRCCWPLNADPLDGENLDSDVLLQSHAEAAIALAGFSSVIAALGRPLSPFARQRFLSLLGLSIIQVLGCLLPLWVLHLIESPSMGWRLLSVVFLGMNALRIWWLVVLPTRTLEGARVILNRPVTRFINGTAALGFLCLLLNTIGVGVPPNFGLYYAGLLASLLVGFALFADVATRDS